MTQIDFCATTVVGKAFGNNVELLPSIDELFELELWLI
jgi:hypothetical protein